MFGGYRDSEHDGSPRLFRFTPWVRRILAVNIGVFFLQETIFTGRWAIETFGFAPAQTLTRPWSAFTYMFLHGGFIHLAVNMLMLFIFGAAVEERLGSRAFARYYVVCGLGGAGLSLLLGPALGVGQIPVIGASGAVLGVALAFAYFWPDAPVFVLPFPIPIKVKWLVAFLAVMNLVSAINTAQHGVAYLAHLGGFAAGYLFLKLRTGSPGGNEARVPRVVPTKVLVHPAARRRAEVPPPADRSGPARHRKELDRVLEKISAEGVESLSDDERQLLLEESERLRKEE